jgi:hypothetical protein
MNERCHRGEVAGIRQYSGHNNSQKGTKAAVAEETIEHAAPTPTPK